MTRGWPLAVTVIALASVPLYSRTLGALAVGALFALWLLTLTERKPKPPEYSKGKGVR